MLTTHFPLCRCTSLIYGMCSLLPLSLSFTFWIFHSLDLIYNCIGMFWNLHRFRLFVTFQFSELCFQQSFCFVWSPYIVVECIRYTDRLSLLLFLLYVWRLAKSLWIWCFSCFVLFAKVFNNHLAKNFFLGSVRKKCYTVLHSFWFYQRCCHFFTLSCFTNLKIALRHS